jgi:hypothetical protein
MYAIGSGTVIISVSVGLWLIKKDKDKKED